MTDSDDTQRPMDGDPAEQTGPTVRDKRRIDPETYQVREPQTTAAPAPEAASATDAETVAGEVSDPVTDAEETTEPDEVAQLTAQVAERTADLQRLQAEYVNYKRRVDRDREVIKKQAVGSTLTELLSVLDDIRSAREHEGELSGGFKAVAEGVEKFADRHGVEAYGEAGDRFDPQIHEALMQAPAADVTEPTCVQILQVGYRIADRVVRPARVAVAQPEDPVPVP